jgi:uncharacterized membrane protein
MPLLSIHIGATIFSLGMIALADKEAFAWMRGTKPMLGRRRMRLYHALMWAGLVALITSGILLFLPMGTYLLSQSLFIIKLFFVAILVVNAILIGRLMHIALTRSYASLTWQEKAPLFTSGAVSVFSWTGALAIALYLF